MSSSPSRQSSLILLWAGEDPAVYAALMERLNAAGIPCKNMAIGSDEIAPSADPLPIDWKPRFGFEVAVPSHDLTAAQQILEKPARRGAARPGNSRATTCLRERTAADGFDRTQSHD
jgi:hypothetical protein